MLRVLRKLLSRALMRFDSSDARGGSTDSPTPSEGWLGPASNTCTQLSGITKRQDPLLTCTPKWRHEGMDM